MFSLVMAFLCKTKLLLRLVSTNHLEFRTLVEFEVSNPVSG